MARDSYIAKFPKKRESFTADQLDFLRRRTTPFLEKGGTRYSIGHLLTEAYLQGLRDAADTMGAP